MDAWVHFRSSSGTLVGQSGFEVPDPPPQRRTFEDPKTGAAIEAELVRVKDGLAWYREVGLPSPSEEG